MSDEAPRPGLAHLLEERLDDLYEHAPCGYVSALPDGMIVKVNQTFLDWTGYERDELVGVRRFQDLLTPGGQIYHETHYAPLLRMQGSIKEIALQIRRANGSRLPVLVNSVLRRAEDPEQTVVRTTVFDARDRRAYEEELLHARRREAAARERVERLQRLTQGLAATLDERVIAAGTLDAVMELPGARAARLEAVQADGDALEELGVRGDPSGGWTDEVALEASGRRLGRLQMAFAEGAPTDGDRSFLLACVHQCAQALESARLQVETARAARRGALLAELARGLEETRAQGKRADRLVRLLTRELAEHARVELDGERGERTILAAEGVDAGGEVVELPLRVRGRSLGALVVSRRRPFGRSERAFLADVVGRAALALENASLYEHEHRVAEALQRSMLTRELPVDPRFLVAAYYQPAVELMSVGGDWYDAFEIAPGRLALVVGDVVGRGIEAASAMGQLRSAVRALGGGGSRPHQLLERLDAFVEHVEVARSATLVYGDLDLEAGVLRFACAGHPPPVLQRPGEDPELLWEGRSTPLGAVPWIDRREEAEVRLTPGSRLFLYTDGLVERRDRPIDRGLDELLAAARVRAASPLPATVAELPEVLVRADEARDDVCLLGLELTGSGPPA